ncbi:MAG: DUF4900 domain-containing protein [Candidatus Omnitrophica bacterium]|nr:DUF4900 domain-containing protein [Candidatus Omnitrophota bacterium]
MRHRQSRLQKNVGLPKLANNRGAALVIVLFLMVIFLFLSDIFVLMTLHERNMADVERESAKAFYAAQGGAQSGLNGLDNLINNFLNNTIASSNPSSVIGYTTGRVNSGDGIGWLAYSVRNNNVPVLTQNGDQAEYSANGTAGDNTYQYKIVMMEKSDPVTVTPDVWDFPYNYRIESAGTTGTTSASGEVLLSGDFTIRVQRDNFAKYSLFTNRQTLPGGTINVWFTNMTSFAGPVHTNSRFNFALNPSGRFDDIIQQFEQTARFYNNGSSILLDADFNGTRDVPVFNNTFTRNAGTVTLSSSSQQTDMENQAKGGQTFSSNGIYVPNSGGTLTGGIYVRGDATVNMSLDGNNNAVYTVNQSGTIKTITVDRSSHTTTVVDSQTNTYNGAPDGVDGVGTIIYSTGSITGLGGTVQRDTQMTVASASDMVITNNVVYQDYTPGSGTPGTAGYVPPTAAGTTNLLGLVSWAGNVRIATSAPNNISVHSTILARQGVFQVDNYNSGAPRGTATLLGGIISNDYGAFGTFNGATGQQVSGYGRNFIYDERMEVGNAPPYFPSLNTFIAFTNGIADKIVWQEGGI